MADAELIVGSAAAEALAAEWDALAIERGQPLAAPAWMLGWWHHVAPRPAELRLVAVRDRGRLIGIVPMFVELARRSGSRAYRLLAHDFSPSVTPLARAGRDWEVAAATAELLAAVELRPDSIELGPVPAFSPWAAALRERWPARMRPLALRQSVLPVPTISTAERSFEAWLDERSARVRANARRYRRLFEEAGGTYRLATDATVAADTRSFAALHRSRWEDLGPSRLVVLGERLPMFLNALAQDLGTGERFRLLVLELAGEPICTDIWVAAGGEVTGVNIGWDERYKRLSPPRLAFLHIVEDAFRRGERRLDLGWGGAEVKLGYANGSDAVAWDMLLPCGRQLVRTLPAALPASAGRRLRESGKRVLSDAHLSRLRAMRDRIGRWRP